jgi:hypothetical protein
MTRSANTESPLSNLSPRATNGGDVAPRLNSPGVSGTPNVLQLRSMLREYFPATLEAFEA